MMLRQSRVIGVSGYAAEAASGMDAGISLQGTTTTTGTGTEDLRGGPAVRNTETGIVGEVAAATDRTADAEAFTLVKNLLLARRAVSWSLKLLGYPNGVAEDPHKRLHGSGTRTHKLV
jgi:hypothetical protein